MDRTDRTDRMERRAGARWCAATSAARAPRNAQCLGACALALLLACGSLIGMTTAHASSQGAIILSPATAATGTSVSADVRIFGNTVQTFALEATTTAPDQGGCASAVPIPGAPTFTAGGSAGGQVTFPWPASLSTNSYWLCAFPTAGGPELARTGQPFIVTQSAAPALRVTSPPDGALGGRTLQVNIAGWLAPDHQAPAHLWIVSPDGLTRRDVDFQVLTPPDATGACTLSVVLPLTISPGDWFLIAGSAAYYQRSDTVTVEDPKIATAVALMHATPTATQTIEAPNAVPHSGNATLSFGLIVGVLLLLLVGASALLFVRRGH